MLIIDGDYPMAYGAIDLDRDLTRPIDEVRNAKPSSSRCESSPDSETMATIPEMRRGGIAAALAKICVRIQRSGSSLSGYRSGEVASAVAHGELAYYRILEAREQVRILHNGSDLTQHMDSWSTATDHSGLPVGLILGLEGADPILWPQQVHDWWNLGVRVVSLSHYGISTYCHGTGTGTDGGLFPAATELLREMDALGMILDVTHASDASVRESLEVFSGPVLASHQNCRALAAGERQFPDDILQAVVQRGAVVGISMDTWMLYQPGIDWADIPRNRRDLFPREAITLSDFVDHIDHVCQLAGNSQHAAIGGDTDGQGGRHAAPAEIDTVADYQKVADVLAGRGYTDKDIENIMYRNWQRFFKTWLPS
ncbi:MAG: membrane dipeptidase [Pirellulales bacterium]